LLTASSRGERSKASMTTPSRAMTDAEGLGYNPL
jgi:hypothetical protein